MGIGSKRASSVVAALCLFSAVSVVGARAKADANTAPSIVKVDAGKTTLFAYAPIANDAPKPLTIYLHGVCGQPANGCPYFREGATSASWLLCPSAPTPCEGGGGSWAGTVAMQERAENDAETRASAAFPNGIDTKAPRVLVGFSQGAYVARNLILAQPGRYRAALFIGADISTTAESFRAAGIERVAFAAGRNDMMRKPLEAEYAKLHAAGFPTRFVDLGNVGHSYVPASGAGDWKETIEWLERSAPAGAPAI